MSVLRRVHTLLLFVLLVSAVGTNALAALVELGNGLVFDNDEARYWYQDLSVFTNMTYDQQTAAITTISVATVAGHRWGAFRMATLSDMESLWTPDKNLAAEINAVFTYTDAYQVNGIWHYQRIGRYDRFYDTTPHGFDEPAHYLARTVESVAPDGSKNYNHNSLDFNSELDAATRSYIGAWVVADASPVPLPASLWLLASGVIGLVGVKRRTSR